MKKNIGVVSLMMILLASAAFLPAASAQDCANPGFVSKLIEKFKDECKAEGETTVSGCISNASKVAKVINVVNTFANNGVLTIGARTIEFGQNQTGSIIAPGNRQFVSAGLLDKDRVSISLTKTDGKATCVVTICKVNENGSPTKLDSVTISGDANNGVVYNKSFSGLKGNLIRVFLDGQGGLARKFSFTFKATKS
ncbi:MAG TPA: hypothetical protein VNO70_08610 [Blastocatellia bacterium]|nr:hypothetical protein [Blastocatellia bacterium]